MRCQAGGCQNDACSHHAWCDRNCYSNELRPWFVVMCSQRAAAASAVRLVMYHVVFSFIILCVIPSASLHRRCHTCSSAAIAAFINDVLSYIYIGSVLTPTFIKRSGSCLRFAARTASSHVAQEGCAGSCGHQLPAPPDRTCEPYFAIEIGVHRKHRGSACDFAQEQRGAEPRPAVQDRDALRLLAPASSR